MKKILYVIDDINYSCGAQKAALFQMERLKGQYEIYLFSLTAPQICIPFLDKNHILDCEIWKIAEPYALSFRCVMLNEKYSILEKLLRILYTVGLRCGLGNILFEQLYGKKIQSLLNNFDDVIVVSEASKLRRLVSLLKKPKKIQWIHTDYSRWSQFSRWSKSVTRYDSLIYKNFDVIVVLSEYCKQGLIEKIPLISKKVRVIPNLIDGEKIQRLSKEFPPIEIAKKCLKLVTVARLDKEKCGGMILEIARELREHIEFKWYIIGTGPEKEKLQKESERLGINDKVMFTGFLENPYSIMKECDIFVLTSKYEGTPVTIDEAMTLGLKIVAPPIGGIPEQLANYECYKLAEGKMIKKAILELKDRPRENGMNFAKKNAEVTCALQELL